MKKKFYALLQKQKVISALLALLMIFSPVSAIQVYAATDFTATISTSEQWSMKLSEIFEGVDIDLTNFYVESLTADGGGDPTAASVFLDGGYSHYDHEEMPCGNDYAMDSDGALTIGFEASTPGTYLFTLKIDGVASRTVQITVTGASTPPANHAPTAKSTVPTKSITGTGTASFTASDIAEDSDNDPLSITAISADPNSATATAALDSGTVTVTGVAAGTTSVKITVSDGNATVDVTVPITVTAANHAPTAKGTVPTQSMVEAGTASFTASDIAEDSDDDSLSITAVSAEPDSATATASFNSGTVTVTGVAAGTTSVKVTVSDGNATVDVTVPITVAEIQHKDTITTSETWSWKLSYIFGEYASKDSLSLNLLTEQNGGDTSNVSIFLNGGPQQYENKPLDLKDAPVPHDGAIQIGFHASIAGIYIFELVDGTSVRIIQVTVTDANPAPTVTSISPTSGPATGGTTVTITGTEFTGATAVKFGTASTSDFTVHSDTQITATSPAGSGTVDVMVTTAGGTSATGVSDQFTYFAVPAATTGDASDISSTAATLNGTVNANNLSTTVTFEYGTTTGYGTGVTADQSPVTGTSFTSVSCSPSDLQPDTTYHYRVIAVNIGGTKNGADQTFTTPALPVTAAVDSVEATNGTITITLDKVPSVPPDAADFAATCKVDSDTAADLPLSDFVWDESTQTITFAFTPIAQKDSAQSVVIAVSYNDSESVSAAEFTVDAQSPINKTLLSITEPDAITGITNGTAKTAAALGLPETVVLSTDDGDVDAEVHWDVAGLDYDKSKKTEQTFTVTGTVVLPTGVVNTNDVELTTEISITVKAATGGDTPTHTITGFLLDYATKTVPYGTKLASLNLPAKIKAVGAEISNLWINVSDWVCSSFKPTVPGTYTFKAQLDSGYADSGYVLDSSVSAPEIEVTVKENHTGSQDGSSSNSDSTSSSSSASTYKTETKVDTTGNTATVTTWPDSVSTNGETASIQAAVPSVTVDNTSTSTNGNTVDTAKKAAVTINVPTAAIVQQLVAKKDVDLTITVPSEVAKDAIGNAAVTINANKEILEAAKENLADVIIKIKDADTQQLAYSWTFKGEDLAKSTVPVSDVNIAMSVHLTTEVPKVNVITPNNKGMVLSFDHSGLLPSVASVQFSAQEKGFKPGQTLYFYYYNPSTYQIESLGKDAYTVDAEGNVTVQISHCSDYVLLPKAVRTITLDTRTYMMSPKKSYEIGVKLTGVSNTTIKAYSSTKEVANVTVLKNGNVKATGVKTGVTYIMIDVYDNKNNFLTHASIKLTVQNGVKASGNSARQYGIF